MAHHSSPQTDQPPIRAGEQVAQLRHMLGRAEEIAGSARRGGAGYDALDEVARISASYQHSGAMPRRRFDAFAEETTTWAVAALDALHAASDAGSQPRAAAAQLARELETALREMARAIRA